MKKFYLIFHFSILILFFSDHSFAQRADTINVLAENRVHMGGYGMYSAWAVFPPDTNSYRKVLLNFTLGCPNAGCSGWDYTVDIYLVHKTGTKDSNLKKAPSFTVNNGIKDTLTVKKDTTYTTYYDTITHKTDSTANPPYVIVQYKDSLTPTTPTDTVKWWKDNYYNYYYDSLGHKTDSILVTIDTTLYLKYYTYWNVYDSVQTYEIARMITPYGGYYNASWTYPYVFDVSDFDWMMHDSVQIQVFYSGWTDGFLATCNFQMITGIPPHQAYNAIPMWNGTFPYGSASNPISNYLVPRPIKIDSAASAVRLRILQTGHGEDVNNCSEFCANYQHVKVNGVEHFTPYVWRDVCGLNPLLHQSGTWLYDRANWCPGEQITPYLDDLTPYVRPSQTDTILMSMDPYISPNGGSVYTIGSELVYYHPINFSLDATLDDIVSPTNNPYYSRLNPSCSRPQVIIRNTGSTPMTSCDITYGAVGGITNTYHWTGNLLFDDTALVTLPTVSLATSVTPYQFRAKVSKPNGGTDQYGNNDSLTTTFTYVPNYASPFIIVLITNLAGWEDSYFIADDNGNVIHYKSGFGNNTTNRDTINLPPGCYHFELNDLGKDGLYFFANSDGNGALQFRKINNTMIKSFQSDFGTSIIQNFTVGSQTGMDELPANIDYKVYPNPTNEELTISELNASGEDKDIKLYSELGELVYQKHIPAGTSKYNINVSGVAQGLYCLVISNNDGVVVKKIVISH